MTRSGGRKNSSDDLVISCCKDGKVAKLKEVLNDKSLSLSKNVIKAFYIAIASDDTNLLNTLVLNFPLKVFLDLFLSKSYEEVYLNGIKISEKMDRLVQNFLFDFRFVVNSEEDSTEDLTKERLSLLLDIIARITESEKFTFLSKLIVQNIFVLKKSLKRSYIAIPWEEMEFLLSTFIRTTDLTIKAIAISSLTKPKICEYLKTFASLIQNFFVDESSFENVFPPDTREVTVERIILKNPTIEKFYKDFKYVHDMHCLSEISQYTDVALLNGLSEVEKKFLVHKAISVCSKYMSDSFESPGLSLETRLRVYLMLPQDIGDVFIDLIVAPHLSTTLETRNLQNLMKNLQVNVVSLITHHEINAMKNILDDIANPITTIEVLNEKSLCFKSSDPDINMISNFRLLQVKKLKNLVDSIGKKIEDGTVYERFMFEQIDKNNFVFNNDVKFSNFSWFKALGQNVDNPEGAFIKNFVALSILPYFSKKISSEIAHSVLLYLYEILESIYSRKIQESAFDDRLLVDLFLLSDFETEKLPWLQDLKNKFLSKLELKIDQSLMSKKEPEIIKNINEIIVNYVKNDSSKNLEEMDKNIKIKTLFELFISQVSKNVNFQKKFLNEYSPVWTGFYLKSGLDVFDIRFLDHKFALAANTQRFISFKKKFSAKFVVPEMREKFEFTCSVLDAHKKLFHAFLEGDSDFVHECLKTIDIRVKNNDLWTAHHFAALGPDVELLKYVLKSLPGQDLKDINGNTPLHVAALYGRTENVEVLIKSNALVNIKNNVGSTPLHLAALNAHGDIVKILLSHNACFLSHDVIGRTPLAYCFNRNSIDIRKHVKVAKMILEMFKNVNIVIQINGMTPLHLFVLLNSLEMVKYLCYRNANVNCCCVERKTPLHTAAIARNSDLDIVRCLITHGADVNACDMTGTTPLTYAIQFDNTEVARILLKNGAIMKGFDPSLIFQSDINMVKCLLENYTYTDTDSLINAAARNNQTEILKILLSKNNGLNSQALHLASSYGCLQAAEMLIKNNFNVNEIKEGKTPLHLAVENGRKGLVELLIKNDADLDIPTAEGKTALHLAAYSGQVDIINLLINQSSINTDSYTGLSPLHIAVAYGHHDAAVSLLQCQAFKTMLTEDSMTPFHFAVLEGDIKMIEILINHNASVDQRNEKDVPPLILACGKGYRNVVELLIASGANVNAEYNNVTPLLSAIQNSQNLLIDILVANGADVNANLGRPLIKAITNANLTAVECLLDNHAYLNIRDDQNMTPLHFAAGSSNCLIVQTLINRGSLVDARTKDLFTSLHLAVEHSYEKNVLVLLESGASVNQRNKYKQTPLHIASTKDNLEIVHHLLTFGAKIFLRDLDNKTPLDYAILHGHSSIVELLLKHTNPNRRLGNLLTMASEVNNVETLKLLVNHGLDMHEKSLGLKPIHAAAAKGIVPVVDFYLKKGLSVNETDSNNQTLLHHAVRNNNADIIEFLVSSGAKVNAKDINGLTPICIAAESGFTKIVAVLLKNGSVCKNNDKIINFKAKDIIDFSNKLLKATKNNNKDEVEDCVRKGAVVDCKDQTGMTPLHIAAWKGYIEIVDVLINNEVNVNSTDDQLYTPLHYAVRCSHVTIVTKLLHKNAVYNALSQKGESPSDLSKNPYLTKLFKYIEDLFKSVEKNDGEIINKIQLLDVETIKAIMGSKNRNGKTSTLIAIENHYSKYEDLIELGQNCALDYYKALECYQKQEYNRSIEHFKEVYKIKKEILGADNPSTLSLRLHIADCCVGNKNYDEALSIYNEVFKKFSNLFSQHHIKVLQVRASIAILMLEKGNFNDGYQTLLSTCEIMKKCVKPQNPVLINAQLFLASALEKINLKEQALDLNREIYNNSTDFFQMQKATENITFLICQQGKVSEAAAHIKQTYLMVKCTYGLKSENTKIMLNTFSRLLHTQSSYENDTEDLEFVLEEQKKIEGVRPQEIFVTELHLADNLFNEGNIIKAHGHYESALDLSQRFNVENIAYFQAKQGLEQCKISLGLENSISHFTFSSSIIKGQTKVVLSYIKEGTNVNELIDGKSPLQIAVFHNKLDIIELLMENGADPLVVSNIKGNTPLHAAVSMNNIRMAELLLKKSKKATQYKLVNAKTTAKNTTALHIAAEKGFYEMVLLLLKYGAIFNPINSAAKSPLDISKGKVYDFLKNVETQFKYSVLGITTQLDILKTLELDEFSAVTNARNFVEKTLLQVAINFKHSNFVKILSGMLREKQI